jgi:release factor glutamine methyltransferase
MTYREWLHQSATTLQHAGIESARLDALVLLCDELSQGKAWIIAHDELDLTAAQQRSLDAKLARRQKRVPLAYIRSTQEFYGHSFVVTPDVLIPRPETESLIELLGSLHLAKDSTITDIGTGSGAIAITVKLKHPSYHVIATDVGAEALRIATNNAHQLHAQVNFRQGNLLEPMDRPIDCIIANLPYVDSTWERSPETDYEPSLALFANDHGLQLICQLLTQAPQHLNTPGYIILEADPKQHPTIIELAAAHGFDHLSTNGYGILLSH